MAGSHPGLRIEDDRRIKPDVVGVLRDERLPPRLLDVVLQFDAEGAVVPRVGESAVDFRSLKTNPYCFA